MSILFILSMSAGLFSVFSGADHRLPLWQKRFWLAPNLVATKLAFTGAIDRRKNNSMKINCNMQTFLPAIVCLLMAGGGALLASTPPRIVQPTTIPTQAIFDVPVSGPPTNYLFRLSTNASRTMAFAPANGNQATDRLWLATNSTLWTWPVSLSCVGFAPNVGTSGNLMVLIAPDLVYFANHLAGVIGTNLIFHDTNGVLWIGSIDNEIHLQGDMALGILSRPAPASIVLPYIMPVGGVTNFPGGKIIKIPAFWLHNNKAQIEYTYISATPEYTPRGMPTGDFINVETGSGPFAGTPGTVGDSSSPLFTLYRNKLIFLGTATFGGSGLLGFGSAGSFSYISGQTNFAAWQRSGLTNGVRLLTAY